MRANRLRLALAFAGLSTTILWSQQAPVTAVITDQTPLETRAKFGQVNFYVMGENGDVFFTSGNNSGLFQWTPGGAKRRLLQTNDALNAIGLPPELVEQLPPGGLVDTLSQPQTFGADQLAFVANVALKGERDPAGILVWDGTATRILNADIDSISQFYVNAKGRLAVAGLSDPLNLGLAQIFMEKESGETVKIAEQGQPAAGGVGGTYASLTLIGHSATGQVAFLAGINGGPSPFVLYITDGGTPRVLVKTGDTLTGGGTITLRGPASNYFMNNQGQVAFAADANGGTSGIWVAAAGVALAKVFRANDPTASDLGGTFIAPFALRDFNDAGTVLFSANLGGGSAPHALFLRNAASGATQVIFAKGKPTGEGALFDTTQQASLNREGKVAFLVSLTGGPAGLAWFLGAGGEPATKIVAEGDPAPGGGKIGLAGRLAGASINSKSQVTLVADVLEANAVGLFWWAPGSELMAAVTTNDDLPDGANTVLRAGPPISSDTETIVRSFRAGGSSTYYAVSLAGDGATRRIAADFDTLGDTATLLTLNNFTFNSSGAAVFLSTVLGAGGYPKQALFAATPDAGLQMIAAIGDEAPGGGRFVSFGAPQLNNKPEVYFFANLDASSGIFMAAPDPVGLKKVVRLGDPWPGGPANMTFAGLNNNLSVNDKGQVAFLGNSSNPGRPGLFVGSATDPPAKVAEGTAPAPVGTFNGFPVPVKLTASGEVLFNANYGGPTGGGSGVFLARPGDPARALAASGGRVPGGGTSNFQFFNPASLIASNSGAVGFWAGVCCSINNALLILEPGGDVRTRLTDGIAVPGSGSTGAISPGLRLTALSDAGELAVYSPDHQNTPMQQQILVVGADGKVRRLAGSGEPAADTQSEYGKLIGSLMATPGGRFVFSSILVNGPAKSGVFISNPQP